MLGESCFEPSAPKVSNDSLRILEGFLKDFSFNDQFRGVGGCSEDYSKILAGFLQDFRPFVAILQGFLPQLVPCCSRILSVADS